MASTWLRSEGVPNSVHWYIGCWHQTQRSRVRAGLEGISEVKVTRIVLRETLFGAGCQFSFKVHPVGSRYSRVIVRSYLTIRQEKATAWTQRRLIVSWDISRCQDRPSAPRVLQARLSKININTDVLGTVVGLLQCHGNRYPGSLYEACRDIGKAEYEEYVQSCAKLHFGLLCEDPSVRLKWTSHAWGHERMNTTRMAGALRAMPASVRPQLTLLKVLWVHEAWVRMSTICRREKILQHDRIYGARRSINLSELFIRTKEWYNMVLTIYNPYKWP